MAARELGNLLIRPRGMRRRGLSGLQLIELALTCGAPT